MASAESRYLEKIKDLEINQAISEDLSSFYNALEWALMKFHKERMGVINNLVREMWHSTYKGKDIDYVEIRAEESASTSQFPFILTTSVCSIEIYESSRTGSHSNVLSIFDIMHRRYFLMN